MMIYLLNIEDGGGFDDDVKIFVLPMVKKRWILVINYHHHHQVPDLEQTLAVMPLQTSLSSDNFKKFKLLLCPPVAELQRLSRNVILCMPLSRLPSTFPVKDKNSKPLRLHTCPKNSICYESYH